MAINVEYDVFAEMDAEVEAAAVKAAAAKAKASNVFFFKLQDGQKAMVRFLLDLRGGVSVMKHEYYNNSTKTWEMSSVCAQSIDLDPSFCVHCQTAATRLQNAKTKEERKEAEKQEAKKMFIYPVFVYGIKRPVKDAQGHTRKDAQGREIFEDVTYKDKEGKEHSQTGIRYIQVKGTAPLLTALRANYQELEEGDSFLKHDMTISLSCTNGDIMKPVYTPVLRNPSKFIAPDGVEVPEQTREDIFERLLDLWKPALIDGPDHDAFGANPPAQSNGNGAKPAKAGVPDF